MKPARQRTILIAPGPFKECLKASEVARAIAKGVRDVLPQSDLILCPLADGGSGIKELLVAATNGAEVPIQVRGPLGEDLNTSIGILGDGHTAIIESAAICGLALTPIERRNPLHTTTYGIGEAILKAIEIGAGRIIVGCGDSATNDCGIGMASAVNVAFGGCDPHQVLVGADLERLRHIDIAATQRQLAGVKFEVACNLSSVLCGDGGTSRIYAPQKGATPDDVLRLEAGVENFVDLAWRDLNRDVAYLPGAGGAGGLAASLYACLGASLRFSFDVVNEFLELDALLKRATLVITGEGMVDDRTATGKIACALALRAKRYNLPVVAVAGVISPDCEDVYYNGIDTIFAIQDAPMTLAESLCRAPDLISNATSRFMRMVVSTEI